MSYSESDAIHEARTGRTLAEIMLARGAELPRTAPATVEQIATKAAAEQVEDVPAVEVGDVPTDAVSRERLLRQEVTRWS